MLFSFSKKKQSILQSQYFSQINFFDPDFCFTFHILIFISMHQWRQKGVLGRKFPRAPGPPIGTVLGNPLCISVKELPTLQGRPRAPRSELPPLIDTPLQFCRRSMAPACPISDVPDNQYIQDIQSKWAFCMRFVPQVVQNSSGLQCPLSDSLGRHYLRYLQQGYVSQGCAQKPHGQTLGQYLVRTVQSDVCNEIFAEETSAEF
jgi:hypothetical protein